MVEFNVSLPTSTNQESQILTHQCTIQTQRRPVFDSGMGNNIMCPSTTSCIIPVKTVFGRILPKCNVTKGEVSLLLYKLCCKLSPQARSPSISLK